MTWYYDIAFLVEHGHHIQPQYQDSIHKAEEWLALHHNDNSKDKVILFYIKYISLKGWVRCFSFQVIMNKCFFLNPEKIASDSSCRFREKGKKTHL